MLQFIIFLPLLAAIVAAVALAHKIKCSGIRMERLLHGFDWRILGSPAQVAFFMFSITAAIAATIITGAHVRTSTQLILTLDIISFASSLLLILFHQFREYDFASVV